MNKLFAAAATVALCMASQAPAAIADITTKSGTIAPPAKGTGQVIFYRTSAMGALLGCTARENDVEVARLGVGKYYVVPVAPGLHEYTSKSIESKDKLKIEVEDGETYYIECSIAMGFMAGHPKLKPSNESDFAVKAKGLKLWDGPKAKAAAAAGGTAN